MEPTNSECFGTPDSISDVRLGLSSLPQTFTNPEGVAPQIQNGINVNHLVFNLIIDSERESLRQDSMESKVDRMNTGKKN